MRIDFKKAYINGDERIFGSRNIYGIWNNLMYKFNVSKINSKNPLPNQK